MSSLCFRCSCVPPSRGPLAAAVSPQSARVGAGRMCVWVSWVPRGTAVPYSSVGDGACQARGVAVPFTEPQFLQAGSRFCPPSGASGLWREIQPELCGLVRA